jgi:hypothetical protein
VLLPPLLSSARRVKTPGSPHDNIEVGKPISRPVLPISIPKVDLPKSSEVVKAVETPMEAVSSTYVSPSVFPSLSSLFPILFFLSNLFQFLSILRIPLILLHLCLPSLLVKENTLLTCSSSFSSGSHGTDSTRTDSSSSASSSSHLPPPLSSPLALFSSSSFFGLAVF